MSFHVGQKVVCVDASLPANPWHRQHPLVLKQIYVIHKLEPYRDGLCFDIDGSGRTWENRRFRPLIERKTDIGVFTALLNPKTQTPLPEKPRVKVSDRQS